MGVCSVCREETNYKCVTCQVFICNRNLDCHVPVEEDSLPGWLMGKQVALCHACNSARSVSKETAKSSDGLKFEMKCASRGFHVYRTVWKPKVGEKLQMKPEYANVHDPFAISINASLKGKLTAFDAVGHVPRDISRFCRYFLNYGGELEGRVRDVRYRKSPIPKGGLEIPIVMIVRKHNASLPVFKKMKDLVSTITLMISHEKLKCRQVKTVLRYFVPNRHKFPEKYAHHLLFMFYPFRNEEHLKSSNSGTFSEKLQEPGVLNVVNRNKQIFEPFGDLVDTAMLNRRTDLAHHQDSYAQQENDEIEEELLNTANDLPSEDPADDAVVLNDSYTSIPSSTPIVLSDDELNTNIRSLNQKQREYFDIIYDWAKNT